MPVDSQALRDRLRETDDEFRQLSIRHQELDSRLKQLVNRNYLSDSEELEQVTLKKQKLQLKDQMEQIIRRHRDTIDPLAVDSLGPVLGV